MTAMSNGVVVVLIYIRRPRRQNADAYNSAVPEFERRQPAQAFHLSDNTMSKAWIRNSSL